MLPGVECARRRRLHQSVAGGRESANLAANGGTRRSCLSLYPTNNETHHTTFSLMEHQAYQDVELGGVAKEARDRLDERLKLRPQRKSHNKRDNSISKGCLRCVEELQRDGESYGSKKSGSKLLNWAKFSWNVSVEGKCAVCM
ncbi:uncharacterized protein LOC111996984 isoform X2 [Quercus suber]|uniref:uncharacterized protein LOC111996984 isoform X2 n=1 Tax=Quercus suber TaxID=58331 RepID=UPI000CE17BF4|nr:uncharacterized protein LOC111996984 isoform X2 [Quercus suber]POE70214.1 hypothetical protein CFP56_63581 [Quercus suber]